VHTTRLIMSVTVGRSSTSMSRPTALSAAGHPASMTSRASTGSRTKATSKSFERAVGEGAVEVPSR